MNNPKHHHELLHPGLNLKRGTGQIDPGWQGATAAWAQGEGHARALGNGSRTSGLEDAPQTQPDGPAVHDVVILTCYPFEEGARTTNFHTRQKPQRQPEGEHRVSRGETEETPGKAQGTRGAQYKPRTHLAYSRFLALRKAQGR